MVFHLPPNRDGQKGDSQKQCKDSGEEEQSNEDKQNAAQSLQSNGLELDQRVDMSEQAVNMSEKPRNKLGREQIVDLSSKKALFNQIKYSLQEAELA